MNWTLKIAAYLSKSPACALFPEKDEELSHRLMQTACGGNFSEDVCREAAGIDHIASGMDIPPFIEKLDGACFRNNPVLTHPLSGQEYPLTLPPNLTPEQVSAHIEKTLGAMVGKISVDNQKELFFTLWRQFSGALTQEDPTGLGQLWKNLPADARIPSHTIWEHAAVSSAIAGAWPDPAILIFTIASAQDMVATARRTQDAWMGSFLWSYLSWQAIKVIAEKCGPDAVISPSLKGQPMVDWWLYKDLNLQMVNRPGKDILEIGNIPNMFTAIVPADQAKSLAQECEKAVQDAWEKIANKVKMAVEEAYQTARQHHQQANIDISSWDAWNEIWKRQSDAFVHNQGVFWVICPWGEDHNGVIEAKKGGDHVSEELKDLESILRNMTLKGCDPHIGMVFHLLSSFAGMELTARKNLRNFKQTKELGHKCSLCGKWEVVHPTFPDGSTSYSHLRNFWEDLGRIGRIKENLKLAGRIRRGDMLCSICLTRRLALEACFEEELNLDHHMFPSTAGIATAAYRGRILKECVKSPDLAGALKDYVGKLGLFVKGHHFPYPAASTDYLKKCARGCKGGAREAFLRIDGDWLASGAYEEALQREDETITKEEIDNCKESAGKLVKKAKELGLGNLPGYYAILALDGDHVGNWVTGTKVEDRVTGTKDHAPNYRWLIHPKIRQEDLITNILPSGFKRPMGPAMQLALSDSLKNFSLTFARDIVEKDHAGKLVYAGGDDLLAFLPTEHLLSAMRSLYRCFRGMKNGYELKGDELLRLTGGVHDRESSDYRHEGVTASMGVVIVHHSYPLYHAMQEAQAVLKETAKKQLGRNAFAIRLLRRSGESTEGGYKFNADVQSCTGDVLQLLDDIVRYIKEDHLSGRLPYTMAEHRWAEGEDRGLDCARRTELARITARHTGKTLPEERIKIKQTVLNLFNVINDHPKGLNAWDMTARLLLILRFMAGKER